MKNIRKGVYYITRDFDNDEIILKGDKLSYSPYFGIQFTELLNQDTDLPEVIIVIRHYKDESISKKDPSYEEKFLLSLNDTGSLYINPIATYSIDGPTGYKINIEAIYQDKNSVQFRIECLNEMKEISIHTREHMEGQHWAIVNKIYQEIMIEILGDTLHSYLMEAYLDGAGRDDGKAGVAHKYAKIKLEKIVNGDKY